MIALTQIILHSDAEIRKFKYKEKAFMLIIMIILLLFMPIIQAFRAMNDKSLRGFIAVFQEMRNVNLLVSFIGEIGSSMQPWLLVKRIIPEFENYRFGQSYIASFIAVIPSALLDGFSVSRYARLSGWFQTVANMSYGPGFSILAEAYYNFGWFGVPILYLVGRLYSEILSINMIRGELLRYKNVFSSIALYAIITGSRSSLYLTIRTYFYVIVIPIVIIKLMYSHFQKKSGSTLYRKNSAV